jgi:ubiquinone/menaquinone biosynthesis C-methylase UbiE
MSKIANYDELDYDYSTYWNKRDYEHQSEVLVLDKLLKKDSGKWFLDVGGSFGRVLPTYYDKYSNCVIVDYSLKTLQKNYSILKEQFPNIELISANAYYLPFKEDTFDGALMIRVLHHLDKPKTYISEIYRVISPMGIYIQEFANKQHLKALNRAILKLDFEIFNTSPYQQPDRKNNEGARENANVPFLNYHTVWIKRVLVKKGFKIVKKYGCSFFRIQTLKRILGSKVLLFFENISQNIFSFLDLSPSIFIKSIKEIENEGSKKNIGNRVDDILVCPKCKGELNITEKKAVCKECKKEYYKKENIWDFRI